MSHANEKFIINGNGYAESLGKGAVKIQFDGTISAADTRDMAHQLIFLADLASGATKCEHGRIKDYCTMCLFTIQAVKLPEGFLATNEFHVARGSDGSYAIGAGSDHPERLDRTEALNLVAWLITKADLKEHEVRLAQAAVALEVPKDEWR